MKVPSALGALAFACGLARGRHRLSDRRALQANVIAAGYGQQRSRGLGLSR